MFKPVRIIASIVFIASVVLVLVGAFVLGNGVCVLWYSISRHVSDTCLFRSFRFYVWVSISIFPAIFIYLSPTYSICDCRIFGLHLVYTVIYSLCAYCSHKSSWFRVKIFTIRKCFGIVYYNLFIRALRAIGMYSNIMAWTAGNRVLYIYSYNHGSVWSL